MGSLFDQRVEQQGLPGRLGDVTLRYDTSMLIAERPRQVSQSLPTVLQAVALTGAGLAAVGLLQNDGLTLALVGVGVCALGLWGSTQAFTRDRARRRFVLNFATMTLRLESTHGLQQRPVTRQVAFDDVRAVSLVTQANGLLCLTVEFVTDDKGGLFQEVLVANVSMAQRAAAERLQRVFERALLEPTTTAPPAATGIESVEPVDSFTP